MEDFLRDTSAIKTIDLDSKFSAQYGDGAINWQGWTEMLVESCVSDLTNDEFHAFAVLHNPTTQRFFQPDDDETAFDFARRLNREALNMEATWFFSAMMVPGRTYQDDEVPPSIDAENWDTLRDAIDEGTLKLGVCWFSRGLCRPVVEVAGMITMEDDVIEQIKGDIEPKHNPFHEVLGV